MTAISAAPLIEIRKPSAFANWSGLIGFCGIHLGCLLAVFTGLGLKSLLIAAVLFWTRMFLITAVYHRYFSHRSYRLHRVTQFILAFLTTTGIQKGPLWWAANHRRHHKFSDLPDDVHSPRQVGFWQSHVGWIVSKKFINTDLGVVKDFAVFPELRWLDRYYWVAPLLLAAACFLLDGGRGLVVGFGWSTVVFWHSTFTINSLSHVFGRQRYHTGDDSRNNWLLALLTMGEGWHNNHHWFMNACRQGFFWWEYDPTYYLIRLLGFCKLAWDIKEPPRHILQRPSSAPGDDDPFGIAF